VDPRGVPDRDLPRLALPGRAVAFSALAGGGVARRGGAGLRDLSEAFSPGRLEEARANVTNPLAIESASTTLEVLGACGIALLPLCCLAAAFSMVLRFRRSTREERQQIKWFASAAALLAVSFPFAFALSSGVVEDFVTLTFAGLPVAVGTAVLRYRLYDIDVLINRTLVYGPLTAMLVLFYVGGVVSLQYVFRALSGQESTLAVVASTLAIAALFNPLRRRIQGFIDRRFIVASTTLPRLSKPSPPSLETRRTWTP
jgi:hypothetical protein